MAVIGYKLKNQHAILPATTESISNFKSEPKAVSQSKSVSHGSFNN